MNEERENYRIFRSSPHDINWLLGLIAAQYTCVRLQDELKHRIDEVDGAELMEQIVAGIDEMYSRLLLTYPLEKRMTIKNQKGNLFFHIDVGKKAVENKTHTVVDVDLLDVLVRYSHESCMLCSTPERCNSCPLGRALDRCVPLDREKGKSWAEIDVDCDE